MTCRRFQNDLDEYLDGSLSPQAQAEAEQHLSGCVACREKLKEERQVAQVWSGRFRRATDSLELPPSASQRLLAALADEDSLKAQDQGHVFFWQRLVWPVALAACLLLLVGLSLLWPHVSRPGNPRVQRASAARQLSVQLSYVVPTYTFRLESGFVVDALSYHTNVMNESLPAHPGRAE
jgi:anti-sigma factor RsiW